jgi:hypothetical protein
MCSGYNALRPVSSEVMCPGRNAVRPVTSAAPVTAYGRLGCQLEVNYCRRSECMELYLHAPLAFMAWCSAHGARRHRIERNSDSQRIRMEHRNIWAQQFLLFVLRTMGSGQGEVFSEWDTMFVL